MIRKTGYLLCSAVLASGAHAQSYGLLLSGCRTELYAAGTSFTPGSGLAAGVFMPFYVNDRLVVRAEAGLAAFRSQPPQNESEDPGQRMEANLTVLCRFYLSRKLSLSTGIQGVHNLSPQEPLQVGHAECPVQRTDICLLFGAAFRFNGRIEAGMRFGQGLLPATEMPAYGAAHRREAQLVLSYLLHSKRAGFADRRLWRSGLALADRY